MKKAGRYFGTPKIELLSDGKLVRLTEDFSYVDSQGIKWVAPKGAKADGASIPRVLWTLVGSPLTGAYRDAAIIHDFYCSVRSRDYLATHRAFHEAMLTSKVPTYKAGAMYGAVYWYGPKWTQMDIDNVNLRNGDNPSPDGPSPGPSLPRRELWDIDLTMTSDVSKIPGVKSLNMLRITINQRQMSKEEYQEIERDLSENGIVDASDIEARVDSIMVNKYLSGAVLQEQREEIAWPSALEGRTRKVMMMMRHGVPFEVDVDDFRY